MLSFAYRSEPFLSPKCQVFWSVERRNATVCMPFWVSMGSAGVWNWTILSTYREVQCKTLTEVKPENHCITVMEKWPLSQAVSTFSLFKWLNLFWYTFIEVRFPSSVTMTLNKLELVFSWRQMHAHTHTNTHSNTHSQQECVSAADFFICLSWTLYLRGPTQQKPTKTLFRWQRLER